MKKSPLSTPRPNGQAGSPYHGRGRRRGYGYNNRSKNDNDINNFAGSNNSPNNQNNGNMSFDNNSPTNYNKRNWRHPNDRRNQRFSNSSSSSYNAHQSNSFQSSPGGSPYSPQKYQRYQHQNYNRQKSEPNWHRQLPISEFIDIHSIFQNPWANLEKKFANSVSQDNTETTKNDSSIEIIMEKIDCQNSSLESKTDETTGDVSVINISSSCDEIKEGSSVDLDLDNMNFSKDSKSNTSIKQDVSDTKSLASTIEPQDNQSSDSIIESERNSIVKVSNEV